MAEIDRDKSDITHFIDHVDRQHAHGVSPLHSAGRAELVKCAFSHSGEDPGHGVYAIFWVILHQARHLEPVGTELSP